MPKINGPKKELLQFRASPRQVRLLAELSNLTGQTPSDHLRQALDSYLRQSQPDRGGTTAPPSFDQSVLGQPISILVVENQILVKELLAVACEQTLPSAVVRAVGSGEEALAACRRAPPDLMLLDLILSDGDALDRLKDFFAAVPQLKVIALSSHIDEFTLHRALRSRVLGIVDKNDQPVKILREAIAAVLAGRQYISAAVQRLRDSVRADPAAFNKVLSDREQEVLRLIGEGLTNEQIAGRLAISVSTAKNHRLNIMGSLGIHSAPQLIRYAIDKGFTHFFEGPSKP